MPRPLVIVLGAVFLLVGHSVTSQEASSLTYRQEIVDGQDGKPVLQLTNVSALPITAYVVVQSSYTGGRIWSLNYHDTCTTRLREQPIANGHSIAVSAGYYIDSQFKMDRAEVPAVVFGDGSTAGDPAWIDALLAGRLRFYDRLMSLHDLLKQQIGTGTSLPAIVDELQSAQASAHKQLAHDDLWVMDDTVFMRAISTMQANSGHKVDDLLQMYVKHLEDQMAQLSLCQPPPDNIRTRLANRPNPEQPIVPPFAH